MEDYISLTDITKVDFALLINIRDTRIVKNNLGLNIMPRINYYQTSPEAVKALMHLETFVNKCSLEKKLLELIKLRASQINGCASCVDIHCADAKKPVNLSDVYMPWLCGEKHLSLQKESEPL